MSEKQINAPVSKGREHQESDSIPINGFQQIVEMLRVADPSFRDSLLKRLAMKDKNLAFSLKRDLL
ncbi:hypothetical protein EBS43_07525 [bacterium]|nr:hypothetical protein [bacterium]